MPKRESVDPQFAGCTRTRNGFHGQMPVFTAKCCFHGQRGITTDAARFFFMAKCCFHGQMAITTDATPFHVFIFKAKQIFTAKPFFRGQMSIRPSSL